MIHFLTRWTMLCGKYYPQPKAKSAMHTFLFCSFCCAYGKVTSQTMYSGPIDSILIACNHPILVSKDYKRDIEAVEPKTVKETNKELLDPDDLATALGQLSVNTRKCQVCTMESVCFILDGYSYSCDGQDC